MNEAAVQLEACVAEKLAALRDQLVGLGPLVVAFSGGVDSTYLLAEAHHVLGNNVLAVIADSPSLPREALAEARSVAAQIGARVEVIATEEFANPAYTSNPVNRCYFCKAELFTKLDALARSRGFRAIAYGENSDDMRQERPGRQAAAEFAIVAPLREAGLTKNEIRELSRNRQLPTADAPAQPCLSSRIPHGTPVTLAALRMIERAETAVRRCGFKVLRVRHLAESDARPRARVQVGVDELPNLAASAAAIRAELHALGYDEVEFDPAGYRTGG
jgi:uncharacterized protein